MKFMAEDMLQSMDDAGVDGVVTFAIGIGEPSDYRETNQYIADSMKKHPGRIHGFMRLSPGNGPKDTLQVLEEGIKLGLKGIKIHPLIEHCPANDKEKVYPLMEAAQHHGLTVLFHCGLGEDASPKRIGEVAKDFPKLPIIMGHSGLVEGVREVVEIAKRCENVHMDSSGVGWLPFFCESISWAGPDRVLYGSDHPFNPMDWEIEKIVKTRAETPQTQNRRSPVDHGGQYQAAAQDELIREQVSNTISSSHPGEASTAWIRRLPPLREPTRSDFICICLTCCWHDGRRIAQQRLKKIKRQAEQMVVEGCKQRAGYR